MGRAPTPSAIASSTAASGSGHRSRSTTRSSRRLRSSRRSRRCTTRLRSARSARRGARSTAFRTSRSSTRRSMRRSPTGRPPTRSRLNGASGGSVATGSTGCRSIGWRAKCPCRGSSSVTSAGAAPSPLCWTAVRSTRRWVSRRWKAFRWPRGQEASTPARCSICFVSGGSRRTSSTTPWSTSRACLASAVRAIRANLPELRRSISTRTASQRPSVRWRWRSAGSTHSRSPGALVRGRRTSAGGSSGS